MRLIEFASDDRGLTNALLVFFSVLVLAALLYILFEPVAGGFIEAQASVTSSEQAAAGQDYQRWAWSAVPFIVVVIAVLYLVMQAVVEGRGI